MPSAESLNLAAIVHGLLQVAVLLFNRRGNRPANRYLALLVGVVTLALWNVHVPTAGLPSNWRIIDYNIWCSPFLWGPTLYMYVAVHTSRMRPKLLTFLPHALPALVLFAAQLPLHFLSTNGWLHQDFLIFFRWVVLLAAYVHMSLYIFLCFQILRAYEQDLRDNYSSIEALSLRWLQKLVGVFAVLIAIDMSTTVPAVIRQEEMSFINVVMLAEATAIFAIGYFSLSHTESLFPQDANRERPENSRSKLGAGLSAELLSKLNAVMEDDQAYRKNDLRLSDLAEKVEVSPQLLSQLINEQCQKNFYDFVNEHRVNFAAKRLLDGDTNIKGIAFDSGFNNRVSFNNAFKKYMGTTPSAYRRQRLHADAEGELRA